MNTEFYRMADKSPVEFETYCKAFVQKHPNVHVYVGCDSQNYSNSTIYVTSVVFRFPASGAHVLYRKERVKKIRDLWTRLWNELERSVELAQHLKNECGIMPHQVDLDYNTNPKFASHKVYKAAIGYVESLGFKAMAKPEQLLATYAANTLCH